MEKRACFLYSLSDFFFFFLCSENQVLLEQARSPVMTEKAFVETVPDHINAKGQSFRKTHYTGVIFSYTLLNAGRHEQVANRTSLTGQKHLKQARGQEHVCQVCPAMLPPGILRNSTMGKDVGIAFPHRFSQSGKVCHACHSPWRNCMLGPELNKSAPVTKAEESLWCEEPHSQRNLCL